jgi:hypothetical protein
MITQKTIDRFNRKTIKLNNKINCIQWHGAINSKGIPLFTVNNKPIPAYRASYLFFVDSSLHKGTSVYHTCSNKLCVNPDHLTLDINKAAFSWNNDFSYDLPIINTDSLVPLNDYINKIKTLEDEIKSLKKQLMSK